MYYSGSYSDLSMTWQGFSDYSFKLIKLCAECGKSNCKCKQISMFAFFNKLFREECVKYTGGLPEQMSEWKKASRSKKSHVSLTNENLFNSYLRDQRNTALMIPAAIGSNNVDPVIIYRGLLLLWKAAREVLTKDITGIILSYWVNFTRKFAQASPFIQLGVPQS